MKKLFVLVLLTLCIMTLVFGGGTQATGQADAQKPGTVNLRWALWDWDAVTYYKPLLEAYKVKNPNVNIEWIDLGYTDYGTAIATQLAGDSKIDIITIGDIPTYANLTKVGHLENLNNYVTRSGMDLNIFSGLTDELKINGGLYALPFRSDFWVTYYTCESQVLKYTLYIVYSRFYIRCILCRFYKKFAKIGEFATRKIL